ncbi:MAG: DMT family protein [Verrucomicrobia bacterium]|nr:DMT family protein [Verrucomicrobiota bacterium]MDE3097890.1 DMT family protein [Verrucomicrobiota bacterium]
MNNLTEYRWLPVALPTCSNIFMNIAWYGHLKYKSSPLWMVIIVSWSIAFLEYCFQVPANGWGSAVHSPFQLKIIQEIVTLTVFVAFASLYFGEKFRWNHFAACVCIVAAVAFAFLPNTHVSN